MLTIERFDNAEDTNLMDKSQPVIRVSWPGGSILMGRWTTLCLESGTVPADKATDEQIRHAIETDESVF